ncbi:MAG: hypothetical protein ACYSR3_05510 [Planctomycetota bacterium]
MFTLPGESANIITPKLKLDSTLLRISELSSVQSRQIRKLQGRLALTYLKWKYGSEDTYVLLSYYKDQLVHIEWLVPAQKIRTRYPFINNNSYAVISCLTREEFRGLSIYPSQLQEVVKSKIPAKRFWIWAPFDNKASLKGICKAGAKEAGQVIQIKWFWGIYSRTEFFPESQNS